MGLARTLIYLNQLQKNQWRPLDELHQIQRKKMKHIVDYAYRHVQFYKELFKKAGIHPSDIKNQSDLNKIPLISKEDIKRNFPDKIISNEYNYLKCKIWDTSGSTGLPLRIVYDWKANDFARAVLLRSYFNIGLRYFDRWCYVAPDEFRKDKERGYFITEKIGFISPYYISVFHSIEKKIELLKKFKPRILESLATDLYLIARYIKEKDIKNITPDITVSNGELLDDYMRKYITNVFGVDHFDVYGCMELRRIAWECPKHEGYHIDIDSMVVQFLDDNGEEVSAGEKGRIVLTGLFNHAMPLIRYDIGDIGIPSNHRCSCGRGLPMMKIIQGKLMDFIVTSEGQLLSPHIFKRVLMEIEGIELFKLIQLTKEKIKILIVKNNKYTNENNVKILKIFKRLLGENVLVDIQFVDEIKRRGRKYKVIESRLNLTKF